MNYVIAIAIILFAIAFMWITREKPCPKCNSLRRIVDGWGTHCADCKFKISKW